MSLLFSSYLSQKSCFLIGLSISCFTNRISVAETSSEKLGSTHFEAFKRGGTGVKKTKQMPTHLICCLIYLYFKVQRSHQQNETMTAVPHWWSSCKPILAMFTLYRTRFCSVSKVAPTQCEQDYVHRCVVEIALFQNRSRYTG